MSNLTVSIPHQLSRAEARRRMEQMIRDMQNQYGSVGKMEQHWEGDTLAFTISAMGMSMSGHVYVEDQVVRVDIPMPWPLSMFAGNVRGMIEDEGRKLLGRQADGGKGT